MLQIGAVQTLLNLNLILNVLGYQTYGKITAFICSFYSNECRGIQVLYTKSYLYVDKGDKKC